METRESFELGNWPLMLASALTLYVTMSKSFSSLGPSHQTCTIGKEQKEDLPPQTHLGTSWALILPTLNEDKKDTSGGGMREGWTCAEQQEIQKSTL